MTHPVRVHPTAQEIVTGFPKGANKNRAQHVLNAAQSEGQVQAAYEVLAILQNNDDLHVTLANITTWANVTIETARGNHEQNE